MKKLDAWFEELNKLIQDAFISFKHLSIIEESKKDVMFLNEDFFVFFQYQQWFMLNIQLAKVFECKPRTQQRNILTLFNKIIAQEFSDELVPFFDDTSQNKSGLTYEQFLERVKIQKSVIRKHQTTIDKIITTRNKYYAHTDIERIPNFPTLEEVNAISNLASSIYNNIRGLLYGIHTDFTRGINNLTLSYIIKLLNKRTKLHDKNV
jgi:hypothetical protein